MFHSFRMARQILSLRLHRYSHITAGITRRKGLHTRWVEGEGDELLARYSRKFSAVD